MGTASSSSAATASDADSVSFHSFARRDTVCSIERHEAVMLAVVSPVLW
jgi:hypothetical protein